MKPLLFFAIAFLLANIRVLAQADTVPPLVKLQGDHIVQLAINEQYIEPGVLVYDDNDGIVPYDTVGNNNSGTFYSEFPTGKPVPDSLREICSSVYSIVYRAIDKAGNRDSATRLIFVIDTIAPVVTFFTPLECIWRDSVNSTYYPYSAFTYSDNCSNKSKIHLTFQGCEVETRKEGIYKYRISASDRSGNHSNSAWHYVVVRKYGDTSACVLTDSLKNGCKKYAGIGPDDRASLIQIFPNPANDYFYIATEEPQTVQVRIYDLSGKLVFLDNPKSPLQKYQVSTSNLKNGIYMLEASSGNTRAYRKLVVVH
jgi:hypothetical protein